MSGFQVKVMTPVDQGSSPCGETSSFFCALHVSTRESALLCRSRVVHVMICVGKTFFFCSFLTRHENNQTECVQYLLDTNCPLPSGWRYEHGGVTRARIRNRIRNRIRIRVIICTRMDFCFITTTKRDKTTNKSLMYKIYSTIEIKVIVNKYAASHTLNNHPPPLHSAGIATFGCLLSKCSFICFAFFINAMHT